MLTTVPVPILLNESTPLSLSGFDDLFGANRSARALAPLIATPCAAERFPRRLAEVANSWIAAHPSAPRTEFDAAWLKELDELAFPGWDAVHAGALCLIPGPGGASKYTAAVGHLPRIEVRPAKGRTRRPQRGVCLVTGHSVSCGPFRRESANCCGGFVRLAGELVSPGAALVGVPARFRPASVRRGILS